MKVFILIIFNFTVIFAFSLFFERSNQGDLFRNQQQEKALLKNQEVWFRASDYIARRDFLALHLSELGQEIESNRTRISDLARWINETPKNISLYELSMDEDSIDVSGLAKSEKALQSYLQDRDLKLLSEKGKVFKASGAL